MKRNTKIYSPFKGYTLEDCDCRYCLYYGGKRRRRVLCLPMCASAKAKLRKHAAGKGKDDEPKTNYKTPSCAAMRWRC